MKKKQTFPPSPAPKINRYPCKKKEKTRTPTPVGINQRDNEDYFMPSLGR